jgi:hypothetical protein
MKGPDALGRSGDYLLMNDRAAFIIEGVEQINTYYYYGGILIDAVSLDGCTQKNQEQFEELALFVGELDPHALKTFGVRAFRGERVEILNDGSNGKDAIVRVHGTDDYFWIVELELMKMFKRDIGIPKKLTRPLDVELFVDYILPPDSSVIRIEFNIKNNKKRKRRIFTASGGFFGDSTVNRYYSNHKEGIFSFTIDAGLPYFASSGGTGAYAFGMKDADLGTTNQSGFDVLFNSNLLKNRIILKSAGKPGDTAKVVHYMAVGGSDFNSALYNLNRENPSPLEGWDIKLTPCSGIVKDQKTGSPLPGVWIEVEKKNKNDEWKFIDGFVTNDYGEFEGFIPGFEEEYRLTASLSGRPNPKPVKFYPSSGQNLEVYFSQGGKLAYDVRDQNNRKLPSRIELYQNGKPAQTIYNGPGQGEALVVPGEYEFSVLRGYEYIPVTGKIKIEPGMTADIKTVLVHAVDTTGFLSADMHIHAGPSGDNKISIPERIVTAAVEGLEVAVATDHEALIPWQPAVYETGLEDWVTTVLGQEVTATIPEHVNMFPVESRFDLNARGGPVEWYELNIDELYNAIRERGAGIVQLNHPRGYMVIIDYDRRTGKARMKHPEHIGLEPDDILWSWNFDSVEYQNGNQRVFMDPKNKWSTGTFEDWMSFINHGHRITAVSNTDAHDWTKPGLPRSYFPSSTDSPADFKEEELVNAIKAGKIITSTGAFARVALNNEAEMGDTVITDSGTVDLWIHIESIPQIDVSHFKVFVNCDEVLNVKLDDTSEVINYDGHLDIPVREDSQIVVLGFGKEFLPRGFPQFDPLGVPRFTTNPIYVDQNGDGWEPPGWDGCKYNLP